MDIRIDNEFEFRENSSQTEIFPSSHCIDARANAVHMFLMVHKSFICRKITFFAGYYLTSALLNVYN